ncbi:MAG: tRNA (cytidine(34)-2'-O)-methyltransferase [Phycisphaerales bacterium]
MDQATSKRPNFEIILLQPEIPNNTGNIGRTAAATGCRLHVVHPIGFQMDEKALRRAGLDYWQHVDCQEHDSWTACEVATSSPPWLLTARRGKPVWNAEFQPGDRLIFGRESCGVGPEFTAAFEAKHGADRILNLPMVDAPGIRSLNLATAVAVVVYEGLRQLQNPEAAKI